LLIPDLTVKIAGVSLANPVMPASGCFGYGEEYVPYFDLRRLGAVVVKGTTAEACAGNPPPQPEKKLLRCSSGLYR
jgi:dihydroorotate dehydrogenase (NAD+) catalytic subunit